MSEKTSENKIPTLTFEGKQYNVNDLSEDTKEIIRGLQIAESQIKMHQDTLRLLSIGRNTLADQLREKLTNTK